MKKKIIAIVVLLIGVIGVAGFSWHEYVRYEPIQKEYTVELGVEPDLDAENYIHANEKALKNTKMDFSSVNFEKTGEYKAKAICGEKTVEFVVVVEDTISPEVILAVDEGEYQAIVGKEIKASELIKSVEDKAGIESISFKENQIEIGGGDGNILDTVGLKYDVSGNYKAVFIASDKNGNITEEEIDIKIVEDYLAHVQGIKDLTVEQGSSIDWMDGISSDEKVLEVTADAAGVDLNAPGEYTLNYIIKGDDNETTVEQAVKITVVTPEKAQTLANEGGSIKTTNGTKKSSSSIGSSKTSASGTSSKGSSNSSGSSGKNGSSGKTWNVTATYDDYTESGVHAQGGTFDPNDIED